MGGKTLDQFRSRQQAKDAKTNEVKSPLPDTTSNKAKIKSNN